MPERVLITGGAGFIGTHLAASHLADGDDVHLLVRPGKQVSGNVATVHAVDLQDRDALEDCLRSIAPTIIYHLATSTGRNANCDVDAPELLVDPANLLNMIRAAKRVSPKVMIRAGSIAEYGGNPRTAHEDDRENPSSSYGAALVAATHYCSVLQRQLPFPLHTARLSLTYGPGQAANYMVPALLQGLLRREQVFVRNPLDRRDLAHVNDIVAGLRMLSAANFAQGQIINLTSGHAPSMRQVAYLACDVVGVDRELVHFGKAHPASASTLCVSAERARALLKWRAAISLAEGLASTAAAMRQEIYA
ncbi:NAD-dependent epimerase/dehydratase family protein [Sphingobium sp. SCG-1]|uniref:NAD-dependent epimerase/dehydratase family protein n=1 Tax=Sphingobium sp. SCG-1 TaxID=2072936 RepID=UPI001670037F|nr:NAD(P)-dependent oxidoreductase [Sphingobium sp. SCG-1]